MEIRDIKPGDSRADISRVYEASWKSAYRGILPQTYLDSIPEGRWCQAIDTHGWHTLILSDGGKIAGTSSFCAARSADKTGWGEIISLYLLPESTGRGWGRRLLEAAVDRLAALEYSDIFLWVLEENTHARQFYEKHGFKPGGAFLEDTIGGKSLREMDYVRHL